MDFEKINADDTLNQGRIKINNNGEAVKSQVSELKSDLEELYQVAKPLNFIDTLSFTDGVFIRNQDGEVRQNASFTSTDFIDVGDFTSIYSNGVASLCCYDNNKVFISNISNVKVNFPSGTKYIRICCEVALKNNAILNLLINDLPPMIFEANNTTFKNDSIPTNAIVNGNVLDDFNNLSSNYFDLANTTYFDSVFLRPQDGTTRSGYTDFHTSDFIEISEFKTLKPNNGYFCLYTENKTFTRTYGTSGEKEALQLAENEKYIRIGGQITQTQVIFASKLEEFELMPLMDFTNVEFKNECIPSKAIKNLPTALPTNITTVSNYGGKYTSVQEATSRSDGTDTIIVTRGIYDEANWQISNDEYGNKRTVKNIVGLEKFSTIVRRYGSAYADDVLHTGLECYVKGLSLKALKSEDAASCGYALHADNNWLENGQPNIFEDCYFYSDGRQAVGIGSRPNCDLVFRNCIFETDCDNAGAVFFHNSADTSHQGDNQRITFENCTFHSRKGRALNISVIGDDNNRIKLTLNRCLLYSDDLNGENLIVVEKSGYTGTENTNIDLVNCFGNNVDISQYII